MRTAALIMPCAIIETHKLRDSVICEREANPYGEMSDKRKEA